MPDAADAPSPGPAGPGVAIVGMAGRFPGAPSVAALWNNLLAGREGIEALDDAQLAEAGVPPALAARPDYVRAAAAVDGCALFDPGAFGLTPREAALMDPQQRLFLESAWEALEDAGHDPERFDGRIGVYGGANISTYLLANLLPNAELIAATDPMELAIGNDKDFLATRTSYLLDLRGPALGVQTACSTALVAVHVAAQALLAGECDLALAGGVSVRVPQRGGYVYRPGGIASPDGRCRVFDAAAGGTVLGNGVGVVALRRLDEALAGGDRIVAVLRGTAVNNDGRVKAGYTAPSVAGQAAVILEALAVAGVAAPALGYVEAHGTGTALGDPIELAALGEAFRASGGGAPWRCAVGSVKSNIGHLDSAAGAAGLIKAALAVHTGEIPASLHFARPNPAIDFCGGQFFVPTARQGWPGPAPRRAGVSSFGIGGTNAHAVLEAPPPPAAPAPPARPAQVVVVSARSPAALAAASAQLAAVFGAPAEPEDGAADRAAADRAAADRAAADRAAADRAAADRAAAAAARLADAAFTLQTGRRAFAHRRAAVCRTAAEAAALLGGAVPGAAAGVAGSGGRPVVFLVPGQGTTAAGTGLALYRDEPAFRAAADALAPVLAAELGVGVAALLAGGAVPPARTDHAQAALFVVGWGLAALWRSWGVRPAALAGHSVGEYVAACLAGVFDPAAALRLVCRRGRLMAAQPAGAMLAVGLGEADLAAVLAGHPAVTTAAVNGPDQCVLAGPAEAVERAAAALAAAGVAARRLAVGHAFHSPAMAPAAAAFAAEAAAVPLAPPALPYAANVTGGWATAAEATDPAFWARQIVAPVRFGDGLATLLADARACVLELGAGTLAALARRHPAAGPDRPVAASLPGPGGGDAGDHLMRAAARLWAAGAAIDWPGLHGGARRRRVALPTYPFERRRSWIDPPAARPEAGAAPAAGAPGADQAAAGTAAANPAAAGGPAAPFDPPGPPGPPGAAAGDAVGPGPAGAPPVGAGPAGAPPVAPEAAGPRPALATPYAPPQGELEARLAALWQELFGIAPIGRDDDFFELGGHSLLAAQILARLNAMLPVEVPLDRLFQATTVAGLAGVVRALCAAAGASPVAAPCARTPAGDGAAAAAVADLSDDAVDRLLDELDIEEGVIP